MSEVADFLAGLWLLMQFHWFFALAVPFGFGLFLVMTWDLVNVMRGRLSIFAPPWLHHVLIANAAAVAAIEQHRARKAANPSHKP